MAEMTAPADKLKAIGVLVEEICNYRPRLEALTQRFRQRIEQVEQIEASSASGASQGSGRYWRLAAFVDSLVRLRLFIDHNFNYIETMSVLSVARYLFELTVWLKLLERDSRYGLIYYRELLKKQLEFYLEFRKNAEREISFLRQTGESEQKQVEELMEARLSEMNGIPDEKARDAALHGLMSHEKEITRRIDEEAARKFSLYAEQAKTNGYAFQAHLVEIKVLPEYSKAVAGLEKKLKDFENDTPSDIKALVPNRWRWDKEAERVGMRDEYDFIYGYASRLLHATPASLTTNQKNLEPDEMRVFLKYIRVRSTDVIEMAEKILAEDSVVVQ
ncbi:MAG TPA: hypothetical protein VKB26_02675 [Candidatus Acidoferrales bacterium]|nr:hypothetical protein [Candidatus Acidoferrales bacterium]